MKLKATTVVAGMAHDRYAQAMASTAPVNKDTHGQAPMDRNEWGRLSWVRDAGRAPKAPPRILAPATTNMTLGP